MGATPVSSRPPTGVGDGAVGPGVLVTTGAGLLVPVSAAVPSAAAGAAVTPTRTSASTSAARGRLTPCG